MNQETLETVLLPHMYPTTYPGKACRCRSHLSWASAAVYIPAIVVTIFESVVTRFELWLKVVQPL